MVLYNGEKMCFSIQIVMEELEAVESYLLREVYPSSLSKGEKANLRQKCKNNFNLEDGNSVLQESSRWWQELYTMEDLCEEDKSRIMESCHAGVEGKFR